ncbi:unnamed protein product [Allacma fusca]|uniref:Uncharacterized protein n=1 Tax=Allacma fusca TaxID=39272 RepID=A0A8J2KMK3_9HEXA|nr:unnamed protein product [Allacma fusca]
MPGAWRKRRCSGLQPMGKTGSNNYTKKVKLLRQNMATYFKNVNNVPWQENYVRFARWNPGENFFKPAAMVAPN